MSPNPPTLFSHKIGPRLPGNHFRGVRRRPSASEARGHRATFFEAQAWKIELPARAFFLPASRLRRREERERAVRCEARSTQFSARAHQVRKKDTMFQLG